MYPNAKCPKGGSMSWWYSDYLAGVPCHGPCIRADCGRFTGRIKVRIIDCKGHITLLDPRLKSAVAVINSIGDKWGRIGEAIYCEGVRSLLFNGPVLSMGLGCGKLSFFDMRRGLLCHHKSDGPGQHLVVRPDLQGDSGLYHTIGFGWRVSGFD